MKKLPRNGAHTGGLAKPDTAQQTLDELIAGYVQKLPGKLDAIRSAARPLHNGINSCRALVELQALLHKLSGSAGTYNCPAVGTAARACEHLIDTCIEAGAEPGSETLDLLEEKLADLQSAISQRVGEYITPQSGFSGPRT